MTESCIFQEIHHNKKISGASV